MKEMIKCDANPIWLPLRRNGSPLCASLACYNIDSEAMFTLTPDGDPSENVCQAIQSPSKFVSRCDATFASSCAIVFHDYWDDNGGPDDFSIEKMIRRVIAASSRQW